MLAAPTPFAPTVATVILGETIPCGLLEGLTLPDSCALFSVLSHHSWEKRGPWIAELLCPYNHVGCTFSVSQIWKNRCLMNRDSKEYHGMFPGTVMSFKTWLYWYKKERLHELSVLIIKHLNICYLATFIHKFIISFCGFSLYPR